ncbi:NAD(P)-dependent oxidoreductase [Corynebacterium nuruki]|jgi:putative NADH-flavin reductase|uniref:NAD(P)-dependent oxidoreductase n=1 Tax=Corynebacterium nuruki TaxID=1032851 RepID=UPI0026576E68|nr:NAD(P)H-binding protein [Corynebacterium nuruki]
MSTITVYGATGMVGSEIVTEAVARGYQVTGVTHGNPDHVKNPVAGVSYVSGDIADTGDVVEKAKATDIIVFSVPGARDGSSVQPIIDAHSRIVAAFAGAGVTARIFIVGGAGATRTPDGTLLKDTPDFPAAYKPEAESFAQILDLWRGSAKSLDWTMLAPSPEIAPGEATASYALGDDVAAGGFVTAGTFAKAALDELDTPAHRRARFIVSNA